MMFATLVCFAKNETTVCFTVNPPLVCNNCENKVKENIKFEKGVKSIKPSAKTNTVEVTYDADKTNVENLIKGFKKIGYDAALADSKACPAAESPCCKQEKKCCKNGGEKCCKENPEVCPEPTSENCVQPSVEKCVQSSGERCVEPAPCH